MNERICTCLGTCKGADGLADGWLCPLELEPIEVHLNTRDCEPMTPETAAALARVFKATYEQLANVR